MAVEKESSVHCCHSSDAEIDGSPISVIWALNDRDRRIMEVFDMKCLRKVI